MADTATAVPEVPTPLLDKFELLRAALNDELVERENEIHGILVALLSGHHIFLLGSPGVGKSFLVDRVDAYIEGTDLFKILMSRFTTPTEVFGPVDVPAMKESRQKWNITGFLPWANVAWMDEIWKSNSSILNALLGILNERTFRNDGKVGEVPLQTLFCASNELPEADGLAAIYDRIMLRYEVMPIRETTSFVRMLQTKVDPKPTPILTWTEIMTAKKEVAAMPINPKVYDTLVELRTKLKEEGIEPTERRFSQLISVLQAEAWLDGAEAVEREHTSIAMHSFWDRPDQQAAVEKIVLDVANPMEKRLIELMGVIEKLSADIDKAVASGEDKARLGMEIHRKLDQTNTEYQSISADIGTSRRQRDLLEVCRQRLHSVTLRMIGDLFGLPTDDVKPPEA